MNDVNSTNDQRQTRLHRTLIHIDDRPTKSQLIVTVTGWQQNPITISAAILPTELFKTAEAGTYLFGKVNIGAETNDDLEFHAIELAPLPDEDDGLG